MRRDGHAELIRLLRGALGFPIAEAGLVDLGDPAVFGDFGDWADDDFDDTDLDDTDLDDTDPDEQDGLEEDDDADSGAGPGAPPDRRAAAAAARELRYRATRELLTEAVRGGRPRAVYAEPVLALEIEGAVALLEADALVYREGGRFTVVGIRSFPVIDGQAPTAGLTAAVRQLALHQLALRRMLEQAAGPGAAGLVADEIVLICPENYSNVPVAVRHHARQQADAIELLLARQSRAERRAALARLAESLPGGLDFDLGRAAGLPAPRRSADDLAKALDSVPARYGAGCRAACDLAGYCGREAARAEIPALLGATVRDALAGIPSLGAALQLLHGAAEPAAEQAEAVRMLRRAAQLRAEILGGGTGR